MANETAAEALAALTVYVFGPFVIIAAWLVGFFSLVKVCKKLQKWADD